MLGWVKPVVGNLVTDENKLITRFRFAQLIRILNEIWASLPFSTTEQPKILRTQSSLVFKINRLHYFLTSYKAIQTNICPLLINILPLLFDIRQLLSYIVTMLACIGKM